MYNFFRREGVLVKKDVPGEWMCWREIEKKAKRIYKADFFIDMDAEPNTVWHVFMDFKQDGFCLKLGNQQGAALGYVEFQHTGNSHVSKAWTSLYEYEAVRVCPADSQPSFQVLPFSCRVFPGTS